MVNYVTLLRAIAAILITNSHYIGIYPSDIIANGGLLGDVLFFAVSGFCLANPKVGFYEWYLRRFLRVYPVVWIITLVYVLTGLYTLDKQNLFWYFIHPTNYHFVPSIMLLYIPLYVVLKVDYLKKRISTLMIVMLIIQLLWYLFAYDYSYYHIDTVREPMIRFLYFQSMLIGILFRINHSRYINHRTRIDWIALVLLVLAYGISKTCFVKIHSIAQYQLFNQIVLLGLLYAVFKCASSLETKISSISSASMKLISGVAAITLEIYLVQIPIIPLLSKLSVFPLNFIVTTSAILFGALTLHKVSQMVNVVIDKCLHKDK